MRYDFTIHFKRKSFKRTIEVFDCGARTGNPAYWLDEYDFKHEVANNIAWINCGGAMWVECPEHPDADEKYGSIGYWSLAKSTNNASAWIGLFELLMKLEAEQ